ncbi:MAG: hypothetical protein AB8B83_06280 [Bdellovibrionales bacterium]
MALDATDPKLLAQEMEAVDNSIIAARVGDPPGGMVSGVLPAGIATGGHVYTPQESIVGMDLISELGPMALLPPVQNDFAATFNNTDSGPSQDVQKIASFELDTLEYNG